MTETEADILLTVVIVNKYISKWIYGEKQNGAEWGKLSAEVQWSIELFKKEAVLIVFVFINQPYEGKWLQLSNELITKKKNQIMINVRLILWHGFCSTSFVQTPLPPPRAVLHFLNDQDFVARCAQSQLPKYVYTTRQHCFSFISLWK